MYLRCRVRLTTFSLRDESRQLTLQTNILYVLIIKSKILITMILHSIIPLPLNDMNVKYVLIKYILELFHWQAYNIILHEIYELVQSNAVWVEY